MSRGLAVGSFALAGGFWLATFGLALAAFEPAVAAIWIVPAIGLWFRSAANLWRRDWGAAFTWWLSTLAAPVVALVLILDRKEKKTEMNIVDRIERAERQVLELQRELRELRGLVHEPGRPQPAEPAPAPAAAPVPVRRFDPPRRPEPAPAVPPPPAKPPREIDLSELLGARALAWAGGVVTLLGVVFFFVLAVNRGWVGELERVILGGLASTLVLAAGIVVRRRYGQLYSALAAAGAGIAGGYATLLAAAALYGMVPDVGALAIAAGIAGVGVWLALAWRAEMLAALGLVGATLVPLSVVFDGGVSVLGTAFAGIVFAATAFVTVRERWVPTLAAGLVASGVQIAWLVTQEGEGAAGRVVALAAAFVGLYLAAGVAAHLRGLVREGSTLVLASASLGIAAALALLNGELAGAGRQGLALLGLGAVYGILAAAFFERRRELSALLTAPALLASALGFADLLGGTTLALVWAVQAAVLAWLGRRVLDRRFQLASAAYLALAAGHALAFEAPLTDLYRESGEPAGGIPALLAVVLAALVFADRATGWRGDTPGRWLAWTARVAPVARLVALAGAAVGVAYTAALGALALVELADPPRAFDWGHVAVAGVWACIAAAALVLGRREAGIAWTGVTLASFLFFDVSALGPEPRGWAAVAIGAPLLAAGYIVRREIGLAIVAASAGLAAYAAHTLVELQPERGLAYLLVAAGYGALAASAFRRDRDLTTVLWASAIALGIVGAVQVLDGTALVAAFAGAGAALAWLSFATIERRLFAAAIGLAGGALALSLARLAPPGDFLASNASPANGAAAVLLAAAALLAPALLGDWSSEPRDRFDAWLDEISGPLRRGLGWLAGVSGIYGVSLVILGAAAWIGAADVTTEFQRGHTAVSAFWGLLALGLLYVGLTRGSAAIRVAGFALFGLTLAKIFLYDLSTLSSVTRALSFLAVGTVLLLAGFFYQRLASGDARAT